MKRGEHTTQQLILQAGKQEFLEKGFAKASLREIAKIAGVTTGAIYGYFPDKEALFHALVQEPAKVMLEQFLTSQQGFDRLAPTQKAERMNRYTVDSQNQLMDYIYDHVEVFQLIVNCSQGTKYEGYIDEMVAIEETYMLRLLDALSRTDRNVPRIITPEVVHILCSSCFHGLFEIIAHNMPRKEGLRHIKVISDFYRAGWAAILGL